MRIIVGVTGGIAAYKAAHLVRSFTEAGHDVRVIPTQSSLNFVGAATWEALTGQPATTSVFEDVDQVAHVKLGQEADLIVIAPATADFVSKIATGRADDLLSASVLVATCPVVVAPAMHTEMWRNPATVANVSTLRERGIHVLEPASGRLTGKDSGPGRLPEPEDIAAFALSVSQINQDLAGLKVVITAGGTHEPLDPVRFLGNNSSGLQGIKLAEAAKVRGADVTLIAGVVTVPLPHGLDVRHATTALDIERDVNDLAPGADVVIMAAAIADFRPVKRLDAKIKKVQGQEPEPIRLTKNPDILAGLAANRQRPGQIIVGFAAETGDETGTVLDHGRAKALRKKADLLVVNEVGDGLGFGTPHNTVTILDAAGEPVGETTGDKLAVSHAILDHVAKLAADNRKN
ncbi:bifunctional phosphopantothenoylcysteine decarboxylase/phosphopantothenate--cysteine ligase CoaBC [Populibacterium corticicola]|uniref:Coenzyme A biosynthesis bifunctional protein CoaBC n=1 Tax=Populibacterium corticicola TaxID=1812826 RepID=A0ABW5XBE0_9MICO